MKLSDIANLQSGLVLNRKEARYPEETVKVYKRLNLRSLSSYNEIDHKELDIFSAKDMLDLAVLTQPGDIVMKLFTPISPVVITEHDVGLVIPSQLAVIRIFNNEISAAIPEILAIDSGSFWFSPVTRRVAISKNNQDWDIC